MTGRLINADELKKSIIKKLGIASKEFLLESEKAVFEEIDKAPTVEAEPVEEWLLNHYEVGNEYQNKVVDALISLYRMEMKEK